MNLNATLEKLCELTPEAVEAVTAALYRNHPGLREKIGPRGVAACRTDVGYHMEYLCGALLAGHAAPFVDYALWLSQVLRGRQVRDDVLGESFTVLSQFLSRHLAAEEAERVRLVLAEGAAALGARSEGPGLSGQLPAPLPDDATRYLGNLLSGNRKAAAADIVVRQAAGVSLITLETRIIQPAMYEVGKLWQKNQISVAQEHLASAITQAVMAEAFSGADFAEPNGYKALFANVEFNHHALGLRMVADAFEVAGWEVQCLGANVPTVSIISQVDALQPELLALSVSLPSQFVALARLIEQVRAEFGARCPHILVGGLAINAMHGIAERLGADASIFDAEAASLLAREFSRPSP